MTVESRLLFTLFLIGLLVFSAGSVMADGAGVSGASFLRIEAGSRASAMGGAFTALADDGSAMYWNPAGMSRLDQITFSASHQRQILDVKNELMSVALPLGFSNTMGLAGRLLHSTDSYRTEREEGSEFSNYSGSLGLYYASGERVGFAWGLGAKMIREQLADYNATSYAVDFGVHYQSPRTPLRLGAVIQNIGPEIKFIEEGDPLPRTIRAGWAYDFFPWEKRWTVSNDIIYFQPENLASFAIGTEFYLTKYLALRGGYVTPQDFDADGNFHTGFGIYYSGLSVDYSLLQRSSLEDQHRFSFTYRFGSRPEKRRIRPTIYPEKHKPGDLERELEDLVPGEGIYHEEMIEYWNDQASIHFEARRYEKAIELWFKSLAADPSQRHIYRQVGIAYYELGELEKAQRFLAAASGAEISFESFENNPEAAPEIPEVKKPDLPANTEILNERGQNNFEEGDYQKAVEYWQHSLKQDPGQTHLYRQLGIAFYELGEFEKARYYLDKSSGGRE